APVLGQTTSGGSVRGVVRDEQGAAVRGAAITATSATAPETYTTASDAEGHYRFTNLPPGDYRIVVVLERFTTLVREPIVVRAGMTIGLDLDLKVGAVADTIEVVGDAPLLERTLPSQTVNIDGEFQRSLPLSPRRHWTDFMLLTPGVAGGTLSAQRMIYFVHGASFDSHVTLIDGAEVNPARQEYPGSVHLSTEALADVQIATLGVSASTPLGTGAVVNAVTKSGTNTWTGSATLTWQDMAWNSNNVPGGTSTRSALLQPEVGGGGPLKRDRVWVFGTYRRNDSREGVDRTAAQIDTLKALEPGFTPFDRSSESDYAFGKVTALVTDNHRVHGLYKYDVEPIENVSAQDVEVLVRSVSGGHAGLVQLNSVLGSRVTLRATASVTNSATSTEPARTDTPGRRVFTGTTLISGRRRGLSQIAALDTVSSVAHRVDRRSVGSIDVTLFDLPRLRSHEIQFGIYWQGIDLTTTNEYSNNGFALEELVLRDPANPARGSIPFHRQIFDGPRARTQDAQGRDLAFYLQDVWRIGPTATISAGVRVDRIRHDDNLFGLPTQRSTDVGPRLGINVGVPGDGHATIHASWARRHEAATTTSAASGTTALGFRDLYDVDLDGHFETEFRTPGATALARDRQFDPDRHQPFVDDVTAGYRRQMDDATTVDATYVHRAFRDRLAGVEINGIYDGNVFRGYRNLALNDIYLITNNQWNRQIYNGLELRVARSTPKVNLIGSYTRQWRHLAGTWQPNDPASFIQPGAFANDKGIGDPQGVTASTEANSLSGFSMAQYLVPTSQWRDHVVNLGLTVRAPWQLVLATNYNFSTGPWSGPVVTQISEPDPAFGPPVVILPNGRAVSNPLATTFRFPGSDRSEGQFTVPAIHVWNVRVGRTFTARNAKLEVSVNVLNALNNASDQVLEIGGNNLRDPAYKTFFLRQAPRAGQLSLRLLF
ncbi:MAG TPA: TonB-dependent receptor, partial [Vicinamibacterales bacterium]